MALRTVDKRQSRVKVNKYTIKGDRKALNEEEVFNFTGKLILMATGRR